MKLKNTLKTKALLSAIASFITLTSFGQSINYEGGDDVTMDSIEPWYDGASTSIMIGFDYSPSEGYHDFGHLEEDGKITLTGGENNDKVSTITSVIYIGGKDSYQANGYLILDSAEIDFTGTTFKLFQTGSIQLIGNSTLTLGENTVGETDVGSIISGDSAAIINTSGSLTVNGFMKEYLGTLNVLAGITTINNGLGSSDINISSGATFSLSNATISGATTSSAIYNEGTITSISETTFTDNKIATTDSSPVGAAISNIGNITSISADFKNNSVSADSVSDYYTAAGGAINSIGTIDSIKGDFSNNSASSSNFTATGGAIFNGGTIKSITSNFNYNSVSGYNAAGGAIFSYGQILSISGNFTNNTAIGTIAYGGAVYNEVDASITFTSDTGSNYYYTGNYAGADLESASSSDDENGGFLYMASYTYKDTDYYATTTFNTAKNSSITIGTGKEGYDSIAGNGIINKDGLGTLTVNSSMQYYTGTLNVNYGTMEVNNFLGASAIKIDSGATLSLTISADNTLINSSLSITNAGTLKLVAGINTSAGAEYAISTADLDFDSTDGLGAIAYGGSVSGNTFTVGTIDVISSDALSSSTKVLGGSTIKITDADTSSVVSISTSSASSLTVSSASDLGEALTSIDDKEVLSAWSFEITGVDETDGVVLSFLVSDVEDATLLQLLHRDDESSDWEIITGGTYDADSDLYSVVVNDFCDYALVAVPEPSTYAMIFGALALGLAVYRRRK